MRLITRYLVTARRRRRCRRSISLIQRSVHKFSISLGYTIGLRVSSSSFALSCRRVEYRYFSRVVDIGGVELMTCVLSRSNFTRCERGGSRVRVFSPRSVYNNDAVEAKKPVVASFIGQTTRYNTMSGSIGMIPEDARIRVIVPERRSVIRYTHARFLRVPLIS